MRKTAIILMLVLGLTGCADLIEMPTNNGTGSDALRKSPCACVEIDYDGRGYQWLG